MTVADGFDVSLVMGLAGPRAYARGVAYRGDGRVESNGNGGDRERATVRGSMPYAVELWFDDGEPQWTCTCPAAEDGSFCKHCVAVALSLAGDEHATTLAIAPSEWSGSAAIDDDVVNYVAGLDRDRLVELVVAQAGSDWRLKERLAAEALAAAGQGPSLEAWQRRIDRVFAPYGDFVDYREAAGWASEVGEVIGALGELCDAGHPDAVVVLAEHAHRRADAAINYVDDSDGWLSDISSQLSDLHLRACSEADADPVALARRLVDLELTSELDGFYRAAAVYAEVLGDDGLAEYRRLLQPAWDRLNGGGVDASVTGGGDGGDDGDEDEDFDEVDFDADEYGTDFALRNAMIGWALGTGDPDELIAVRIRDLRLPDDYLEVARALAGSGRSGEAIDWARRGLIEHAGRSRQLLPLREYLAGLLRANGEAGEAIELFWQAFRATPSLASFRRLLDEVADDGAEWSSRCLDALRAQVLDQDHRAPRRSDALIEILLFEGRADEAWEVASEYGCDRRMRMTLARAREATHPLDAIDVYEIEVFGLIDQKKNGAYSAAVDLMARIKALSTRAGEPQRFDDVLGRARTEHRAKRNLKAMLDKKGWPNP